MDKESSGKAGMSASGWSSFKIPNGGSSSDIRKSAAEIRTQVEKEKRVFGGASLLDGGTKLKVG